MSTIGSAAGRVSPATLISLRRPLIVSAVLGALGIVAGTLFGHPLMGVLFAVGLGMGLVNARMLQTGVYRIIATGDPNKRAIMGSSAFRLAFLTIVALGLGFFLRPDGLGVFFGLAAFQLVFMANTIVPVMKEYRRQ